jgi:hypothetical protein
MTGKLGEGGDEEQTYPGGCEHSARARRLGRHVVTAQDKQDQYTLRVTDGLAFSEFRGYEPWQVVALSHVLSPEGGGGAMTSDLTLNVIVAKPVMIKAYQAGIPGNGKPWPDGSKTATIHYIAKKSAEAPFNVAGRTAATLTPTSIFGSVSAASSSAARTMPGTRDGQHPVRTLTLRLPS